MTDPGTDGRGTSGDATRIWKGGHRLWKERTQSRAEANAPSVFLPTPLVCPLLDGAAHRVFKAILVQPRSLSQSGGTAEKCCDVPEATRLWDVGPKPVWGYPENAIEDIQLFLELF